MPEVGPGRYAAATVSKAASGTGGRLIRFDVRVEEGLDVDPDQIAETVAAILNDERSWRGTGRWRFELVADPDAASLHAYLVTPGTTDRLCAPLLTRGQVSCQAGDKVVLNARRWVHGADAYGSDRDRLPALPGQPRVRSRARFRPRRLPGCGAGLRR